MENVFNFVDCKFLSRLEELKPLEEAQQAFSKDGELAPLDLKDEHKVSEFLTLQKAQLLRSSKIISSLRDKLFQLDSDRADGLIKISNLESDVESLKDQVLSAQLKMESLTEKQKTLEDENAGLQSENTNLKQQIEQRECNLKQKDSHIHCLIELVTEIDLSVKDVENLVELGKSIALGEEPSVSTLLGFGEEFETHFDRLCNEDNGAELSHNLEISKTCLEYNPNDTEWTLDRLVKIRSVRKHLRDLRDVASDLYTDMLGGKVEGCAVQ